jgi:cytochrome c oxidase subunit 2
MLLGARLALCATGAILSLAAPRIASADPAVVEIVAKRFEFTPNQVTIHAGAPTILRIRSQDVTHGFFNRPLGIDTDIEPGKTVDVPVTAKAPGRYDVICDHFCGSGHGNMKMTIVVE